MSDSTALSPIRGYSIERWQPFTVADDAHPEYVLVAEPDQPIDSMRFTYLEAEFETDSEAGARLQWETADGARVHGPLLKPMALPARLYLRDDPRWRGLQARLFLESSQPFRVARFTLYGENDLTTPEKLAWPSDFAVIPRRRVIAAEEPVEARLVVPNRLLRALGENHVVFTLTDSFGRVLGEKRVAGRQPQEPWGQTDFLSGSLGATHVNGLHRLYGRVLSSLFQNPLEDQVSLHAIGESPASLFAEPYHYVQDFALALHDGEYHLFYSLGQADARQAEDAPRAARELGHATSIDLCNWTVQPRTLAVDRDNEEEAAVRAPIVFRRPDGFDALYTATNIAGADTIRRAHTTDLYKWEREPAFAFKPNQVWADWSNDRRSLCRNPSVVQHGDVWILFYNAVHRDGRFCVAAAVSSDLTAWTDAGPVILGDESLGSPACMRQHSGRFLLYADGAAFQSDDPLRNWAPIADQRPPGWRGWEFFTDTVSGAAWAMAYRDQTKGNFIQAFPMRMNAAEGTPEIDFSGIVSIRD